MAGGKETPRQKMVGLMYLVLMALLAMNVSKEVLNSFVTINDGIQKTNINFESKNESQYNAFQNAEMNDPIKVKPYNDKAKFVKAEAASLIDYIDNMKRKLIKETDKLPDDAPDSLYNLKYVNSKDNYDVATHILIGEPANPNTGEMSAAELKQLIISFREQLLSQIDDPTRRSSLNIGLETNDFGMVNGVNETWETGLFYHVPLAAVITALSKIQSDIRNAESDIVKELYSNISAKDFKFDTLAAKVIPNRKYVFLGDTFKAEVLVAAFSTTQDPRLEVGFKLDTTTGRPLDADSSGVSVSRGVAKYSFVPKAEGFFEWGGIISIKNPSGEYTPFRFKDEFMVAKPTLVVSPTAMNVFYVGLDNPVEISAPGVAPDNLSVSMSGGSISPKDKAHGQYVVRPSKGKEATISVSATVNGQTKRLGEAKFRIKEVPAPTPYFAGVTGSASVSASAIQASLGVLAKLEDFQFDNVNYKVISFSLSMMYKGSLVEKKSNNNMLTPDMKDMLRAAGKGTKIFVEDIKAEGPGGVKQLGGISVKVL